MGCQTIQLSTVSNWKNQRMKKHIGHAGWQGITQLCFSVSIEVAKFYVPNSFSALDRTFENRLCFLSWSLKCPSKEAVVSFWFKYNVNWSSEPSVLFIPCTCQFPLKATSVNTFRILWKWVFENLANLYCFFIILCNLFIACSPISPIKN